MLLIATLILGLAILVTLATLLSPSLGKSVADKVIVIDTLTFQILGLCILLALNDQNARPLEFGLLVAMLGFLSTIVLARFIIKPKS